MGDDRLEETMNSLCPEMQEAFLTIQGHFRECARCRLILAGFGAPYYIVALERELKINEELNIITSLLSAI